MKKSFLRREDGQSLVEFALVLPVLLFLMCGIIDFGWLFYNQIALNNAAREGARCAVVSYGESNWKREAEDRMRDDLAGINGAVVSVSDPHGQQITASVTASPRILTGFTSTLLGRNTMNLRASCTMRVEG